MDQALPLPCHAPLAGTRRIGSAAVPPCLSSDAGPVSSFSMFARRPRHAIYCLAWPHQDSHGCCHARGKALNNAKITLSNVLLDARMDVPRHYATPVLPVTLFIGAGG